MLFSRKSKKQPYNDNYWLFGAPALHLQGSHRLEEETSKARIFSFLTAKKEYVNLISLTQKSLVNLVVEVFKKMTKVPKFYVTTIMFATSTA